MPDICTQSRGARLLHRLGNSQALQVDARLTPDRQKRGDGALAGNHSALDRLAVADLFQAIVLGVTQGLTEFLPVSSSGHLILVSSLFGWEDQGLAFDAGLHAGTLVVLLGYFWRDWALMVRSAAGDLRRRGRGPALSPPTETLVLITVGSVPVAVAGLLLDGWIAANLREPWLVATMLALFGIVMLAVDRGARGQRPFGDVRLGDVLIIGLAQSLALVPGVSRSGATITAGLACGLDRATAARFAFVLGMPTFAAAAFLELPELVTAGGEWKLALVGAMVAGVVGFAAVHGLLAFLRHRTLAAFAVYRLVVAVVALALLALRPISF